jgi:uncharacterized protein (TIGR00251 family)
MKLQIKAVPGASRDEIVGMIGDAVKIRVTAPPERGQANAAIERLIADTLHIAYSAVRIISGHTSPRKVMEIHGVSAADVLKALHSSRESTSDVSAAASGRE